MIQSRSPLTRQTAQSTIPQIFLREFPKTFPATHQFRLNSPNRCISIFPAKVLSYSKISKVFPHTYLPITQQLYTNYQVWFKIYLHNPIRVPFKSRFSIQSHLVNSTIIHMFIVNFKLVLQFASRFQSNLICPNNRIKSQNTISLVIHQITFQDHNLHAQLAWSTQWFLFDLFIIKV